MRLYAQRGVKPGAGFLPFLVEALGVVLLYLVVDSWASRPPGSSPPHVPEGSELWVALSAADGGVPALGIDLGRGVGQAFGPLDAQALTVFAALGALLVATQLARRARFARLAGAHLGGVQWAGAFAFVVVLLAPAALALYVATVVVVKGLVEAIVWRDASVQARPAPARKSRLDAFLKATRQADRLAAAGAGERALALRLEATRSFVSEGKASSLVEAADALKSNLAAISTADAGEGLDLLVTLRDRAPAAARPALVPVLQRWIGPPPLPDVDRAWSRFEDVVIDALRTGDAQVLDLLHRALELVPADARSPEFSREVARHLLTTLDSTIRLGGGARDATEPETVTAFKVLTSLEVDGRPLERGDVYCALADRAAREGRAAESDARLRRAAAEGSTAAAERVAYAKAVEGYELLVSGDANAAARRLDEALELADEASYRVLAAAVAVICGEPWRVERLVTGLAGAEASFWRAVAALAEGRADEAEATLARVDGQAPAADWSLADEARMLRAEIRGDDVQLVESARRLLVTKCDKWLAEACLDPWPLLAAVARNDEELLAYLLLPLPEVDGLPEWARVAGARTLIRNGTAHAAEGALGQAERAVAKAEELLSVR
jgi:hypothetical protein